MNIKDKFKAEKLAVRAKTVDVEGGHLAVVISMTLPSSMPDDRRLIAVNVVTYEYATFLRGSATVKSHQAS